MQIHIESLDFSNIHPDLEHLSHEAIIEVIQKYYQGISNAEIKKEFKITTSSSLKSLFPEKILTETCDYCNDVYKHSWHTRNTDVIAPYCEKCKHSPEEACRCENCKKKIIVMKKIEEVRKRELIRSVYNEDNFEKVPEEDLTLEDKLYLAVLLRGGLDENLTSISPLIFIKEALAPTPLLTNELIKTLTGRDIIIPHQDSAISSFSEEENYNFPDVYYIDRVIYRINVKPYDRVYPNMIQRLLYPTKEQFESDEQFCYEMWKKISLHESLEYLLFSMNKVGFDFNPGQKTISLFEHLLDHYSVSQLYSLIFRAVANSTKLYQEKKLSKKHAANTVITYCETQGERALAEGWTVTKYRRNYDLPESIISKVFFTSILKISHLGFDEKPSKI